jgi:hypothetical protein
VNNLPLILAFAPLFRSCWRNNLSSLTSATPAGWDFAGDIHPFPPNFHPAGVPGVSSGNVNA